MSKGNRGQRKIGEEKREQRTGEILKQRGAEGGNIRVQMEQRT